MEPALKPKLIDLSVQPERFFDILPPDWQEGIVPFWPDYKLGSKIYGLEIDNEIIGGGIVFTEVSPDTMTYKEEAEKLFEDGMLYFGFLWIDSSHRGKDLGSFWISEIKKQHEKPFWLSIEEYGLHSFYEKNGFHIYKEIKAGEAIEWIMIPKDSHLF